MDPWTWLLVFLAMVLLDIAWVFYMRAANTNNPLGAALNAGAIHLFSISTTIAYVGDQRYASATMLGTILGTYGIVWLGRRRERATVKA